MKITLVGPVYPYRGGIAHFTTSLSWELAAVDHQVQMISFKRQYPSWLYPGESDKDPSEEHEQVEALYTLDSFYAWTWFQAIRQVIDFGPDLVIIQWWTTFWAPAFGIISALLARRRIPVAFCIHNVIPHEKRLLDIWLSRWALSKASAFITLSPKENERLSQLLPGSRIFQSRLPVPHLRKPKLDRAGARWELGISPEDPVLLFFGIVRPYKGLRVLLDALGQLRGQLSPTLIVAGEFWGGEQAYQQQISRLDLTTHVIIENRYIPNEELERYFVAADAFVAPYINGTQSAAIKMAMSYGMPILASDQISSDLPVDDYPIFVHLAGDSVRLAESIRIFFEQYQPERRIQSGSSGWGALLNCIEQIRQTFCNQDRPVI